MRHSQALQKKSVKQKIRSQLKDEQLQIISLTDNQDKIHWEEEGKEFFFKGEMFDVVKTKKADGKILLYCINDKEEKELVKNFNDQTKQNSSADKKSNIKTDNSINLFFVEDEKLFIVFFKKMDIKFSNILIFFPSSIADKISPPPKV